ncbi:MAG: phenylalanine--tRNA ligase subunit alpha, partial [Chloroflexi bacterium]|nr:phenylalanine--tRNA ligase subunit alpha [Chloroflexota bacterium]
MLEELEQLRDRALADLEKAQDLEALDACRRTYLGRRGSLILALRGIGNLPADLRPEAGRLANELRAALEEAFEARGEALRQEALERGLRAGAIDVRLPGRPPSLGYLH